MHGPGYAPQESGPPSGAAIVTLRVFFLACSLLSCGMLAWVTMIRIAVIRKQTADWMLFAGTMMGTLVLLFIAGTYGSQNDDPLKPVDWFVLALLFLISVGSAVRYLVVDIRHVKERRAARAALGGAPYGPGFNAAGTMGYSTGPVPGAPSAGYGYPPQATTRPGYGYPGPDRPATAGPVPPHTPPAQPPGPGPAAPAGSDGPDKPRIDQVRAELDELSDYLRRERDQ
jgi:hypothetical protein